MMEILLVIKLTLMDFTNYRNNDFAIFEYHSINGIETYVYDKEGLEREIQNLQNLENENTNHLEEILKEWPCES